MALIQHPDQLSLLREDPARVPAAVEEMLRYDAPVQMVSRVATIALEIDGVQLPAGQVIALFIGGANRDPAVFERPDAFDVGRPNARKHLSFAGGPHHCLGASLARMEAEIAFTALIERFGELRLAGEPRRRRTFVLRGYEALPISSLS